MKSLFSKSIILVFLVATVLVLPFQSYSVFAEAETQTIWKLTPQVSVPELDLTRTCLSLEDAAPEYQGPFPGQSVGPIHLGSGAGLGFFVNGGMSTSPILGNMIPLKIMISQDQISSTFSYAQDLTGSLITADLLGTMNKDGIDFEITYHIPSDLQTFSKRVQQSFALNEYDGMDYSLLPAEIKGTYSGKISDTDENVYDGVFTSTISGICEKLSVYERDYVALSGSSGRDHLYCAGVFEYLVSNVVVSGSFSVSKEDGDLAMVSIKPVQVVYDASALVKDKPTAIKGEISSTFDKTVNALIEISWNDETTQDPVETVVSNIQPGSGTSFFYPSEDFGEPIVFSDDLPHVVTARIREVHSVEDSKVAFAESNTENNVAKSDVIIKENSGFSIFYAFLDSDANFVMAEGSTDFIRNVYPVAPDDVSFLGMRYEPISWDCATDKSKIELLQKLSDLRAFAGKDFVVGVLPPQYSIPSGKGTSTSVVGFTARSIVGSVVVTNNSPYVVAAHEIGHQLNLRLISEEYVLNNKKEVIFNGNTALGYSVLERAEKKTTCLMGIQIAGPWVCKDCYERLLNRKDLKPTEISATDNFYQQIVYVSGNIVEDGSVEFRTWYRLPQGYSDVSAGTGGNYTFTSLDKNGIDIGKVSFDITPLTYSDSETSGALGSFAFTMPYYEGTSEISLSHLGQIIGKRVVTPNEPVVQLTYPNGGEVFSAQSNQEISWTASDSDGDSLSYAVLRSFDQGKTWVPITINLKDTHYSWKVTPFGDEESFLVRVVVSDGVNTSQDDSEESILMKSDGQPSVDKLVSPSSQSASSSSPNPSSTESNSNSQNFGSFGIAAFAVVVVIVVVIILVYFKRQLKKDDLEGDEDEKVRYDDDDDDDYLNDD